MRSRKWQHSHSVKKLKWWMQRIIYFYYIINWRPLMLFCVGIWMQANSLLLPMHRFFSPGGWFVCCLWSSLQCVISHNFEVAQNQLSKCGNTSADMVIWVNIIIWDYENHKTVAIYLFTIKFFNQSWLVQSQQWYIFQFNFKSINLNQKFWCIFSWKNSFVCVWLFSVSPLRFVAFAFNQIKQWPNETEYQKETEKHFFVNRHSFQLVHSCTHYLVLAH